MLVLLPSLRLLLWRCMVDSLCFIRGSVKPPPFFFVFDLMALLVLCIGIIELW